MPNTRDLLQFARPKRQFLEQQRDRLNEQSESFDLDMKRLRTLLQRTNKEMASYLLAEVDDDALGLLQVKLRYPMLIEIKRGFESKLADVEQEKLRFEAMPEIQHYDFHIGQVEDEIAELREPRDAFLAQVKAWSDNEWFVELNERGFFSPTYKPTFFNHFWDWRAVSMLMEVLEDKLGQDFPNLDAVKKAYTDLRTEVDPLTEAWDDLITKANTLSGLKGDYAETLLAPDRIFLEMYEALTEAILDHLESCSDALRLEIAAEDVFMATFMKKSTGLTKQLQYLSELRATRILTAIQKLDAEIAKLNRKIFKAERKYKSVDQKTIDGLRDLKSDKWEKRHEKLGAMRSRISDFKDYDQGAFTTNYLWWDLMTRGAPGQDIYEVRTFRRANPDWDWRSHVDPFTAPTQSKASHSGTDTSTDSAMDRAALALTQQMQPAASKDDGWDTDAS
ncbi:MAG: hypothetical protein COW42_10735 [Deltaproteobacteria bacterium CG17_big_fil_post_rev_8_21_14_2_50_63_7]|nr:MAG: hypothetical protein COW42_10735 [Deltaproteobacteria bacterium CG17_big_fil_post_rev_8_21_14_2_50_63_7]